MSERSTRVLATPWIISPSADLLLIIATPVLILPLTFLALRGFESAEVRAFVLAFGSLGHNLPGMLRAYGDRALFQRFRVRLTIAPIVFGAFCLFFAMRGSSVVLLVAYLWSVWHAWMQVYGFVRIYDAKGGNIGPVEARLDFALCTAWFVGAVLFSDARLQFVQSMTLSFGFGVLGPSGIAAIRTPMLAVLILVTLAHAGHQFWQLRRGRPVNLLKNLLLLSSIALWWFAHLFIEDILLGLVMFEVAHDVQYLAIVWIFNRARVEKQAGAGAFTGFLFRRSWGMLGVYIAIILAYGGLLPLGQNLLTGQTGQVALYTFVTTSALLHYYLDGFIWKLRETETKSVLGVAGGAGRSSKVTRHGLKCLALAGPILALGLIEDPHRPPDLQEAQAMYASTPEVPATRYHLGKALLLDGKADQGLEHMAWALERQPSNSQWRHEFVVSSIHVARDRGRASDFAAAGRLVRAAARWREDLAEQLHAQAMEMRQGPNAEPVEALLLLRLALHLEPDKAPLYLDVTELYLQLGQTEPAEVFLKRAEHLAPDDPRTKALRTSLSKRQR